MFQTVQDIFYYFIENCSIKVKQNESRKVQKSHFKDLCQCLCFKKRPSNTPDPKKMYGTPSNSEICLCGTVTCGVIDKEEQSESIRTFEAQKKISKNNGCKSCNPKCSEQSIIQIRREFSDTDSYKCCSDNYRLVFLMKFLLCNFYVLILYLCGNSEQFSINVTLNTSQKRFMFS